MAITEKHHSNQNNKKHLNGPLKTSYLDNFSTLDVLALCSMKKASSTQFSIQLISMPRKKKKKK